jgi:hypothetical protein
MTKDDIIRMAREAGFADGVAEIVGLEGFANYFADNKKALEAALEQQQAEPVAWQYKTVEAGVFVSEHRPIDVSVWQEIEWSKPLYATPPAAERPWQGLTDEAIWEIHDRCIPPTEGYVSPVDFARAIEAAHGIKEGT